MGRREKLVRCHRDLGPKTMGPRAAQQVGGESAKSEKHFRGSRRDLLWRWELGTSVYPELWSLNDWEDGYNSKGREGRGKWRTDLGRGMFNWGLFFFRGGGAAREREREREA